MADATQFVFAIARVVPGGIQPLGTAFGIGGDLLATPFHVVTANDQGLIVRLPKVSSLDEYQDTSDIRVEGRRVSIVAADPILDVCILKMDGVTAPGLPLGASDDARVGEDVTIYGFPHANARLVLTQQIASIGARILIDSSGQKLKHVVINGQTREGQSGSPVIGHQTRKVVAMVIGGFQPAGGSGISIGGIDPYTLHQTTHAVSAEYIRRLVP